MMPHRQGTRDTVMIVLQDSTSTLCQAAGPVNPPAVTDGPHCRCCFLLLAPAGRDAAQSISILCSRGGQQPASSPDPHSSFSRFGVSNSCHLGGSDGKNWALESVHTHIRTYAFTYSIGQDCTVGSHTISGPTLDYAPRNAAKQAAHHPRRSAYQPAGPV